MNPGTDFWLRLVDSPERLAALHEARSQSWREWTTAQRKRGLATIHQQADADATARGGSLVGRLFPNEGA